MVVYMQGKFYNTIYIDGDVSQSVFEDDFFSCFHLHTKISMMPSVQYIIGYMQFHYMWRCMLEPVKYTT